MLLRGVRPIEDRLPLSPADRLQYFIDAFVEKPYDAIKNKNILYIHTPFCESKCRYCVCHSSECKSSSDLQEFVDVILPNQVELFKDVFKNIKFDQVFFGGGTPTLFSPEQLDTIFSIIPDFCGIPTKCIECSPVSFSEEHLALFKKYDFSYISVGVQSLDRKICESQNRYWLSECEIKRMSSALQDSGIYFNYDMLCFLWKEDIRDIPVFEDNMRFILQECQPSSITVHQLEQSTFTCERTAAIMDMLLRLIEKNPLYECINSELAPDDVYHDTVYQAVYRLARSDRRDFSQYMWNKYPDLPAEGFDVLGLGYLDNIKVKSNVGRIKYSPNVNDLQLITYNPYFLESYREIRRKKGLISDI